MTLNLICRTCEGVRRKPTVWTCSLISTCMLLHVCASTHASHTHIQIMNKIKILELWLNKLSWSLLDALHIAHTYTHTVIWIYVFSFNKIYDSQVLKLVWRADAQLISLSQSFYIVPDSSSNPVSCPDNHSWMTELHPASAGKADVKPLKWDWKGVG